jgi:pre-mRNA-splicing helicase BRR2
LQVKGLLEIVAAASEFDTLPVRPGEENAVERMIKHAPVAVDRPKYADPHTKVNALLQAHFSRERLSGDMGNDARTAVREASRLLQVGCDRLECPNGWAHGLQCQGTGLLGLAGLDLASLAHPLMIVQFGVQLFTTLL